MGAWHSGPECMCGHQFNTHHGSTADGVAGSCRACVCLVYEAPVPESEELLTELGVVR